MWPRACVDDDDAEGATAAERGESLLGREQRHRGTLDTVAVQADESISGACLQQSPT
jgi:hypothetical protein